MQRKASYVTDGYIEEISHYIYNDLSPTNHPYYTETGIEFDKKSFEKLLKKGEKYVILEDYPHVMVTSFGRFFNVEKPIQYSMRFSANCMHIYIFNEKLNVEEIFENNLWEYDLQVIRNNYKKYGWKYTAQVGKSK